MTKIIPTTKERIKKFNILGVDISIGYAWYAAVLTVLHSKHNTPQGVTIKRVNYLKDSVEEYGIITHRLILWRFKIEVKTVVQYEYSFT
jgi:hypothetical protein